jgi:hypothetical protein
MLLSWQAVESARGQKDFLAYFNEFAGNDPSQIMVTGCDLDCGQDIFRLAQELRLRRISHFTLAVWSSADMSRMGLPPFDVAEPGKPMTGWVAMSTRALHLGEVLHHGYPIDSFRWMESLTPVARVGQTIRLYYIPDSTESRLR